MLKKDKEIQITLAFHRGQGLPMPYEVMKLQNAVLVEYEDPENRNLHKTARIGDRLNEKQAQMLVDCFKVTTVPAWMLTPEDIKLLGVGLDCLWSHRFRQNPTLNCSGKANPDIQALRRKLGL